MRTRFSIRDAKFRTSRMRIKDKNARDYVSYLREVINSNVDYLITQSHTTHQALAVITSAFNIIDLELHDIQERLAALEEIAGIPGK